MLFVAKFQNCERGEVEILKEYTGYISRNFCKAAAAILKL